MSDGMGHWFARWINGSEGQLARIASFEAFGFGSSLASRSEAPVRH
jgi:hypothetical protein